LSYEILAKPIGRSLEILDSIFEVVKVQNWVSAQDILKVQQEYSTLKGELKSSSESSGVRPRKIEGGGSGRQETILKILKEKGQAQVWEIQQIFPEVTKRTLRRDFENLLNQGLIERMGERNGTFYQPKGRT